MKTQFVEIRDDKIVRYFDINDSVDDPDKYQPPMYIRVKEPLRNLAVTYDPVTKSVIEDVTISVGVKKDDFNRLRKKRNRLLSETDWTQGSDNSLSDEERLKYQIYRQKLRDITRTDTPYYVKWPVPLLDGAVYTSKGGIKLWVTDENGSLQVGDSLVSSNTAGYFTKGDHQECL